MGLVSPPSPHSSAHMDSLLGAPDSFPVSVVSPSTKSHFFCEVLLLFGIERCLSQNLFMCIMSFFFSNSIGSIWRAELCLQW